MGVSQWKKKRRRLALFAADNDDEPKKKKSIIGRGCIFLFSNFEKFVSSEAVVPPKHDHLVDLPRGGREVELLVF